MVSPAQRRAQKKWYRKRQAYRHAHHLKSSPSHIKSSRRWAKRNKKKQLGYQRKSYCKNFALHKATASELRDLQHLNHLKQDKILKKLNDRI